MDTTTASSHDAKTNLVETGDQAAYRDKGYFGTQLPPDIADKTMQRAVRGHKLNGGQQKRNYSISKIRCYQLVTLERKRLATALKKC